jgi:FtsP/CotA-like multicopper oxidase with cupredoxin domain
MRKRITEPGWLLVGLTVVALSLATTPAQAGLGVIDGITGPTFNLSAGTAYVSTPDGDNLLIWGYGSGVPQYPGPTLIVNQGDTVTINFTNYLPQPTSIVFPGQADDPTTPADESVTASGGLCLPALGGSDCLLTAEAAPSGGSATYTFTATHAGTYMYHSGTNIELQVEMGLFGAIIVRPTGFNYADRATRTAYGHPDTAYVAEYLYMMSEMDPIVHEKVERGVYDEIDMTAYSPRLWFLNGRAAPDTLYYGSLAPYTQSVPWLPHQPYNALPITHPGEKVLVRFMAASHHIHPPHLHGNNWEEIAIDGRLLTTTPGDQGATGAGPNLRRSGNTHATAPLKTYEVIWDWTGEDLGWDIYGTAGEGLAHTCNGIPDTAPTPGSAGFDTVTHEYCPDHGKTVPVILPEFQDLTLGAFWSGTPFLGALGDLPPGEGGLNIAGGLYHIWHSHSEVELVNNGVFPGGILTFCIVLPHGVLPFP